MSALGGGFNGTGGRIKSATIYNNAAVIVPESVWVTVPFNAEINDVNQWHSTTSNNSRVYLPAGFEYQAIIQNMTLESGVRSCAGGVRIYDSLGNRWSQSLTPNNWGGSVTETPLSLIAQRVVSVVGVYIFADIFQINGFGDMTLSAFYKLTINQFRVA